MITPPINVSVVHISDLHFGLDESKNKNTIDRMTSVVKLMDTIFSKWNDIVIPVITGDIADNGKKEEMDMFVKAMDSTGMSHYGCLIVPGNHDECSKGNEIGTFTFNEEGVSYFQNLQYFYASKAREQLIGRTGGESSVEIRRHECEPFVTKKFLWMDVHSKQKITAFTFDMMQQKIVFVMLDSNPRRTFVSVDFARGEIGEGQLKLLKHIVTDRRYAGYRKVVLLHHHPVYHNYFLKLKDSDKFLEIVWDQASVLFGHKHSHDEWSHGNGYLVAATGLVNNDYTSILRFYNSGQLSLQSTYPNTFNLGTDQK